MLDEEDLILERVFAFFIYFWRMQVNQWKKRKKNDGVCEKSKLRKTIEKLYVSMWVFHVASTRRGGREGKVRKGRKGGK